MRVSIQEVEVGPFLVDLTTGRLLRDGIEVGLRPQACRAFKTLIQNRGQYVDYEHMIAEAWDGTIVSRHTVDVTVGEVKKVLQEFGSWITHRPKVGYRLEAPRSEDLIRKGQHFLNQRTREGFEKALSCFEQAAGEDGTDFRTYEGLAAAYLTMGTYGMRAPNDVYPRFIDAFDRAVALIGLTPELRLQRAHGLHMFERKFAFAESELLRVYREKPGLTRIYSFLAMLYVCTRQFDKAHKILAEGYKVDPLGPLLPAVEVSVCFLARDFQAAAACGRKSVELHPYVHVGRAFYAQALEYCGHLDEAVREYRTLCIMSPGIAWPHALEAACLTKIGRKAEAMQILENLEAIRATDYIDGYYLALAYDFLGKRDAAFAQLERARTDNSAALCLIDVDPKLDSLRNDERFKLLRDRFFTEVAPDSPNRSRAVNPLLS
jgi:DNA-binding winged helix-turn-helix (wHTH) protein